MTEIYAEFGIEVYDESIVYEVLKVMELLGSLKVKKTMGKTYTIRFCTVTREIILLEDLVNEICDRIIPHKETIKELLTKYGEKIYSYFCFVKTSERCDCCLQLNQKIIDLASYFGITIDFKGFNMLIDD